METSVAIATKVLAQRQDFEGKTIFLPCFFAILQSFSFIPHTAEEELIFEYFFFSCHGNQANLGYNKKRYVW